MYRSFRSDPGYLTKYHIKSTVVVLALNALVAVIFPPNPFLFAAFIPAILLMSSPDFRVVAVGCAAALAADAITGSSLPAWSLALLPVASVVWALLLTAFLHNASHDNFRPAAINRPIGEFCGLAQLVGYADWAVVHVLHHAYSDDPDRDPHPPGIKTFWPYLFGLRANVGRVLLNEYFGRWGRTPEARRQLGRMMIASKIGQVAKLSFWWLLLGPTVFSWFFATSVVFKLFHFAWVNYATHRTDETGGLRNIGDGPVYRVLNFFTYGLYYHKNHHLNPKLFDPRRLRSAAVRTEKAAS